MNYDDWKTNEPEEKHCIICGGCITKGKICKDCEADQ
jgi:hypothetical protein